MALYVKTCEWCGEEFEAKRKDTRFCCQQCKVVGRRYVAPTKKACEWCGEEFETRAKHTRFCSRQCRSRAWKQGRPGVDRFYRYGLSHADITKMLKQQGYACAITRRPITTENLHVDHDHKTGKIRGLLHRSANTSLGAFGDSIIGLERAISYLKATS